MRGLDRTHLRNPASLARYSVVFLFLILQIDLLLLKSTIPST